MRGGKFISAPPEYQAQNMKLYLALSGAQWTIARSGARQVSDGRMTEYPMNLNFAKGIWPYEDSQGNLWLSDQSGIYRLRDGQVTRYSEKDGLPPLAFLRPCGGDDEGGIWFALWSALSGGGVARFKDGRFTLYGKSSGLSNLTIYCIFKDREGTIWVGKISDNVGTDEDEPEVLLTHHQHAREHLLARLGRSKGDVPALTCD
jgi:hypothetical protein